MHRRGLVSLRVCSNDQTGLPLNQGNEATGLEAGRAREEREGQAAPASAAPEMRA